MYFLMQSAHASKANNTRFSLHSGCKNQARESRLKRSFRCGCFFEPPWFSTGRLESSRPILHLASNENSRRFHHSQRKSSVTVTAATPACLSHQVSKWNILDSAWISQRWQRFLEVASTRVYFRIQDYAAATVAVIVVQAIIAQDVSHALSSTCPNFFEPRSLVDFTVSPWTKSSSISCCGARLDSFRCGAKKFAAGKGSLVRMRAYAIPAMNGASARRQGRGGKGFEGIGRGIMATNASSTVVKASQFALITGSLASPLASIVNAGSHVDLNVLRASFASSLNLISLCSFVVWMQRSGQLPAETPVVLSQVAFRVLIPCFLMTKVALTLSSHPTASLLFLPLIAIAQVLIGALLGKAAYRYFYGDSPAISPLTYGASMSASSGSAATIATSEKGSGVITKVEKPVTTSNIRRQYSEQYIATKREAIITAACAFGNSFTLPLIFMIGVLGGEETSKVAGYLALYMVGWSPALWTVGYSVIATGDEDLGEIAPKDRFAWTTLVKEFKRLMNPPLYGVLVGVLVGGTPLSHLFLPVANEATMPVTSTGAFAVLWASTAGILRPVFDAAVLLGTATLAVQTIVLASSLAASLPTREAKGSSRETQVDSYSAEELDAVLDTRAFWIISSVRLVVMPVTIIISTVVLQCARILPVDPVYNLVLLAESAMPSAQNLVLLSQLRARTRRLSGVLADLLLRQYALSIIPITFWMALFLAIVKPA